LRLPLTALRVAAVSFVALHGFGLQVAVCG
jgi:hypothetical protein